ncbi:MAG TPA: hypothetical protein VJ302_36945 [Blastocatellia bacterium]|nr:hypothetical protein [Blastocatellia bacterium]
MPARPVRSRIFLPVVRVGLVSDDIKWVAAIAFTSFLGPFLVWKLISQINFLHVPLFLWTGLIGSSAGYAFFFWIRTGRRARWFQHTIRLWLEPSIRRRALPIDRINQRSWLKD